MMKKQSVLIDMPLKDNDQDGDPLAHLKHLAKATREARGLRPKDPNKSDEQIDLSANPLENNEERLEAEYEDNESYEESKEEESEVDSQEEQDDSEKEEEAFEFDPPEFESSHRKTIKNALDQQDSITNPAPRYEIVCESRESLVSRFIMQFIERNITPVRSQHNLQVLDN